jgi:hypothetical protein
MSKNPGSPGGFDGSNESHVGLPGTGLLPDHWMWILEDCFPSTVAATVNTGLKEPPDYKNNLSK